jgi:signal transduction histidine kinase
MNLEPSPTLLGLPGLLLTAVLAAAMGAIGAWWRTGRTLRQDGAVERRRLERQALEAIARAVKAETLLEGVGTVIDEALIRLDRERHVLWMNPAAAALWPAELQRQPSLTSVLGSGELDPILTELPDGEPLSEGLQLRDRRYHVSCLRLAEGETLLALRDITHQERLARARRDMIANISHDLRTPLTSIGLILESLRPDDLPSPAVLATMRQQVAVLRKLAEDLIQLDRIESGRTPLRLARLDLLELLEEVRAALQPQLDQAGVHLELAVRDRIKVLADADQLRRVLVNLVDNAVHASAPGGNIRVVASDQAMEQVEVAVTDDGSGIPPHDLERIFERFYRGDRARGQSGSGLGLAIVKHIVEGHGGTVSATNNAMRGATVRFTLPAG